MRRLIFVSITVLIIFSSCKLKDDTSTSIVEPTTKDAAITVVVPNGGELLPEGSSYQIKWTGTGTTLVRIQYSFDNGSSWGLVVDSLKNTGVYDWWVPSTISNQCRIRISSVDGVSSDVSDKIFAIITNSEERLKIISPNGGELWEAGSAKQIKWYSSHLDSVKIQYTTNNGLVWNLIAVVKNSGTYSWEPVPHTPSTLAKIKIMDAKDGNPSTESENTFEILPERVVKVKSPNGGEKIISGTSRRIEYEAENIENVKISYTTNGGYNWVTIAESTPPVNFYTWAPVPNVNSANCKIRIDNAKDGLPSDVSDSVFTITNQLSKSIKVIYPNGGERWIAGSTQNITWEAEGIQNIKIEYTTNSGVTWNTVAASAPNTKAYAWNSIPSISSDNCKIKVSDPSDPTMFYDESDNFYSMTPTPKVTVTSPNGGEYWQSGSNQEIRWVSENIPNVKIEFTSDGGANWSTIVNSTTTNSGSYPWLNIPNMHSLQCKIKITDVKYGSPTDQSDNNFTISNQVTKSIKVLSPNGGEDWEAGTKQNITWNSSGISKVKIEFSSNKGATWTVLSDSLVGGAYEWNLSETLNSTQCQIRLSDYRDNQVSDISDAVFTISPRKYIFVTQPRGPITYKDSDAIDIVWESSGIKTVGIKFTHTNGVAKYPDIPDFYILVDKVANQGHFTTSFSIPSNQYYVVVYNADEGANKTPSARNIGNFTIVKTDIPSLTLLTPNGGEQWLGNEPNVSSTDYQKYHPYEIRWNGTNLNKVKIEWTTNGGGSWYVVPGADSTANDGSYVWAPGQLDNPVRPDSSDNCKIRISSVDKNVALINDMTDGFFSIHKSKKIRVDFPSDKTEYFEISNADRYPMDVRWTSYAVSTVDIYFSLDNGVSWFSINASAQNQSSLNYPSTGAYEWHYPYDPVAGPFSTLGRVKVVDHSDGKVWDVNDVPFWLNKREGQGN